MELYKINVFLFIFLLQVNTCFAIDIVRWNHGNKNTDTRRDYKVELITQILEKTTPTYGPYHLIEADQGLALQRAVQQVKEGSAINIFMAVTSPEWESKTIPIRIPIRRGILNYRLLMINKQNVSVFESISTRQALQKYRAGLRQGWATTALMEHYDYPIVQANTLDNLYKKLSRYQIDYIPRGINEVFSEASQQSKIYKELVVAPDIAIRTQAPYYIFVCPTEKRLAKRIEAGLEMMIADQSLKALFNKYYADKIIKASLDKRQIIQLDNPDLSPETPLERKELWFEYDQNTQHKN